jgi:hypothetical protein
MLFLSIILILLGVLIFVYSIIVDTKKRAGGITVSAADAETSSPSVSQPSRASMGSGMREKEEGFPSGGKNIYSDEALMKHTRKMYAGENHSGQAAAFDKKISAPVKQTAVLYEDSSHVIDYNNETGVIDSGLEGYNNIKRIGSGELAVEKGGISFSIGKKLYRYDFHRVRDIKTGDKHLALFLHGSDAVKLFIFDAGSDRITATLTAYKEYRRNSELDV